MSTEPVPTSWHDHAPSVPGGALDPLTRLEVIEDVRYLKATYLRLLDTQRWEELVALFVDDATFVLETSTEPVVLHGVAPWLANLRRTLSGGTTVHQVHQAEIDVVDANSAGARWAMTDYVVPSPATGRPPFYGHGHYTETYRRIDGTWRITSLELTRLMLDHPAFTLVPQG
ncbi:nuclear transport factor 2 family protein [Pseudonocardia oroxyli]|uniref:SnoaL-like domain-containing protein n=1 Tax=Pseudonocardia oroxyli TaxID=366584 RepID=A0A1G7TSS5_PSEOR|nr:nuclear transport factor 2 family protein [Pseudonocardia oroxyli]SDG37729.1 SnoaL-like domain-containing protein [Pseudonocardia oroxyli]